MLLVLELSDPFLVAIVGSLTEKWARTGLNDLREIEGWLLLKVQNIFFRLALSGIWECFFGIVNSQLIKEPAVRYK